MSESLSSLFAQTSGSGNPLSVLILPVLLIGLFFFMTRSQRKRQRELRELQEGLGVGDEIIMSSGIYGFITGVEDDLFWVEIDDDVQVRVAKAAIQGRVPERNADDDDQQTDSADKPPARSELNEPSETSTASKEEKS